MNHRDAEDAEEGLHLAPTLERGNEQYIAQRRRGAESYRSFNEAAAVSLGIR